MRKSVSEGQINKVSDRLDSQEYVFILNHLQLLNNLSRGLNSLFLHLYKEGTLDYPRFRFENGAYLCAS